MARPQSQLPFLGRTAIAGIGFTELSKESGRSVLSLAADACRSAIKDAGLDIADADGIVTFSYNNDSVPARAVATAMGMPQPNLLHDISMGGQAPAFLTMQAAAAIQAGIARHVVIFRALNGRSGQRVGRIQVPGPGAALRYPFGLSAYPQTIALWARRYMIETGATTEDLAAVPMAQREWAAMNERAIRRNPLTLEGYLRSPMVADPFRVADCTSEVDGACALLITSLEAARSLRHTPVVIQGAAYAAGSGTGLDDGDALLWDDMSRNYTNLLADDLWGSAGVAPDEVGMAQLYDCFSSSVLFALEGLGIAGRGEAGAFIRSGATRPGGSLPTNTNGGLLNEGYLHGMNTLAEAALQLQGRAGERSTGAETCVVTSGALTDGSALVLARGSN